MISGLLKKTPAKVVTFWSIVVVRVRVRVRVGFRMLRLGLGWVSG
jgi:hypothetical protein